MQRRILALVLIAVLAGVAACIDVPDSMKAQFAPPGPNERSNYRPGNHGTALPALSESPADAAAPDPDAGASPPMAEGGTV